MPKTGTSPRSCRTASGTPETAAGLNRPGLGRIPADEALFLQTLKIAVNGRCRFKAYGIANLPHGRRVTLGPDLLLQKVKNFLLLFTESF
jgi:hypothetical protein